MIPTKVIALICLLASPDSCIRQTVTTSVFSGVRMEGCAVGMPQLANFMADHPQYSLVRWWCEPLDAPQKERA